jgi:hypothetical protein
MAKRLAKWQNGIKWSNEKKVAKWQNDWQNGKTTGKMAI